MKYPFFLCFFLCLMTFNISLKGQDTDFYYLKDYPTYRETVFHFFSHYNIQEYKSSWFNNFRFARNPKGWTVYPMIFSGDSLISSDTIPLWTPGEGFIRGKIPGDIPAPEPLDSAELLSNEKLYEYSIHPFYAYSGWTLDVINFYRDKEPKNLTAHEIYGIGRAYSQAASDILWPHAMWSVKPAKATLLKKSDLRKYIHYSEEAVQHYMKLKDSHPDYHTIVGNIDVKLHNEILAKWYELKIFGYERPARKFIRKYRNEDIYHDFWRAYAERILGEVPQNSILFTNGDNDTYPLLYRQFMKKKDQDVFIINSSLLADPLYYRSLLNKNIYDQEINSNIDAGEYNRLSRTYIFISGEEKRALPFEVIREEVLGSSSFDHEINIDASQYYSTGLNTEGSFDTIFMKAAYSKYLLPAQFMIINLIHDNMSRKKICLTSTSSQNTLDLFFDEELQKNIFTIDISPFNRSNWQGTGFQREDLSEKPLLPFPEPNSTAQKRIFANLMISEAGYIAGIFSKDTTALGLMTEHFFQKYPPEKCGINYSYFWLLHLLFESGNEEEAMKYLPELTDLIRNKVNETDVRDDELYDESILNNLAYIVKLLLGHSGKMSSDQISSLKQIYDTIQARLPDRIDIRMM